MPTRRDPYHVFAFAFLTLTLIGCSNGGGSHSSTPQAPTFTSTPVVQAEEGVAYTYTLAATSSDKSAVAFALTSAPMGATLSGNTISWTPTHAESRVANAFTVTATTPAGYPAAPGGWGKRHFCSPVSL